MCRHVTPKGLATSIPPSIRGLPFPLKKGPPLAWIAWHGAHPSLGETLELELKHVPSPETWS